MTTDNQTLRELAMKALPLGHDYMATQRFNAAANPQTILAKLDEIDALKAENARLIRKEM